MKQNWTHVDEKGWMIQELRGQGKTRQEIADDLGFSKRQIKDWIMRNNRRARKVEAGLSPRLRGRPPKENPTTEKEKDRTIKRLRMENELLRDFLHAVGRK